MNRRIAVPCPVGQLGFDTNERLTAAQYKEMRALGFRFAGRYLGDLTSEELDDANGADIGIVPIQHAHGSGWTVDNSKGGLDGRRAVADANAAALPLMALWADVEGCNPATTPDVLLTYSRAWCEPVVRAGFEGRVYVGAEVPGDENELYRLAWTGYWKSQSAVKTPARRGFQLIQLFVGPHGECLVGELFPQCPPVVRDLLIDIDVVQTDYHGGVPQMAVAAT